MLKSVGCDNRKMVEAACQKQRGAIDVYKALHDDGNGEKEAGETAALFHELEECAGFGDNATEDIKAGIRRREQDAAAAGLYILRPHALAQLLKTY